MHEITINCQEGWFFWPSALWQAAPRGTIDAFTCWNIFLYLSIRFGIILQRGAGAAGALHHRQSRRLCDVLSAWPSGLALFLCRWQFYTGKLSRDFGRHSGPRPWNARAHPIITSPAIKINSACQCAEDYNSPFGESYQTGFPDSLYRSGQGACPSNRRVAIPARRDDFWLPSSSGDDGVPDTDGTPRSRAAEGGQKARRPAGGPEMPRLLCCRISQTHY